MTLIQAMQEGLASRLSIDLRRPGCYVEAWRLGLLGMAGTGKWVYFVTIASV
jgi:hypothetical protein